MLQYFENISPLVERMWSALQNDVRIMGCYTGRGLWRHPRWPTFWAPSWILPKIRDCQKALKIGIFYAWHVEYDIIKHFPGFCWHFLHLPPKKSEKSRLAFFVKNGRLVHVLLMTSYLVGIGTDSHQTCVKLCLRKNLFTASIDFIQTRQKT